MNVRMSLLDRAFYLLDSARSPQDFTLIFHLKDAPEVDRFYAGAKSAMNRFPASACCNDGHAWVWRENKYFKLEIVTAASEIESRSAIERFVDQSFDLRRQPPVKQILILDGSKKACLATRFHHAAADGLSAALWLGHQLNVAFGVEAAEVERGAFDGVVLRRQRASVRRSEFAFEGASDRLWTTRSKGCGARRWVTIGFKSRELQKGCRCAGGFTYNDLLATCALEVFRRWNSAHGRPRRAAPTNGTEVHQNDWAPVAPDRIGLWMPMNVRRRAAEGFGNGTSRIRVYAKYDANATLIEKCREVRRQVSWTSERGEWIVPEISWFTRLPRPIISPLLRGYLNLPSVDMATGVFSHAPSAMANACEAFKHVEQIECVGLLHPRQSLAINAATHSGQTWLTLTYDPAQLATADVEELSRLYEQQIAIARKELL